MGRMGRLATRGAWCCAAVLLVLLPVAVWAEPDGPRHYYLGPWVWEDTKEGIGPHWRAPEGTVGLVDLRGSSGGVGFFATEVELADPAYVFLGDDLSDPVPEAEWEAALPVDIEPGTVLDALWDTITLHADPDGVAMCPPLIPTHRGVLELHLGGHSLVRSRKFQGEADPAWPLIQARLQRDYRRIREHALRTGSGDRTLHRRVLATWQQKYRIQDEAKFIPPDLPVERARKPETIITDDFNRADSGSLGSSSEGWSWTVLAGDFDISSNRAASRGDLVATQAKARAEYDLSSDDHYAEVTVYWSSGAWHPGAASTRLSTTAANYWAGPSPGDNHFHLWRGNTNLVDVFGPVSSGIVVRLESDGSTHRGYANGSLKYTHTDSTYSGIVRTGIGYYNTGAGTMDNFEAADLQPGIAPHVMYYQRMRAARLDVEDWVRREMGWTTGESLVEAVLCER